MIFGMDSQASADAIVTPASSEKKSCRFCGSDISDKAALCSVCKMYQKSWWRNWLPNVASLVALVSIIGSAWIYSYQALRTQFAPEGLRIIDVESAHKSVLFNYGKTDLWATGITFDVPGIIREAQPINQTVKAEGFLAVDWEKPARTNSKPLNVTDASVQEWIKTHSPLSDFTVFYFTENDPSLHMMEEAGLTSALAASGTATVHYITPRNGREHEQRVKIRVLVYERSTGFTSSSK